MRASPSLIIVGILTMAASAAVAENAAPQVYPVPGLGQSRLIGDPYPVDGRPRAAFIVDGDLDPLPPPPPELENNGPAKIFYMNKSGGTYTPGTNDARTNRSTIVGQTRQVPAWNVSAAGWSSVMTCMTTMFARWNVVITDVDPGNVPHWEIVVAGRPQDIGMQAGVGGVSPFQCGTINNSIVFTFAVVYGSAYRDICETSAQEIAHSFGLDHERVCADPMTYLTGCGNKSFQNTAAACGEYSNRTCMCGGSTQNSVAVLDQRLGLYKPPPMPVDAGVDAPMTQVDAAPPAPIDAAPPAPIDGGENPAEPDASENPASPDGGAGPQDEISGGCGCASSPGNGTTPHVLLLAMVVLAVIRSRSRGRLHRDTSGRTWPRSR